MLGFFKVPFLVDIVVYILEGIYGVVGNYGVAIIVTTCIVRLAMLPLTLKQEKSMLKMKEIQPKLEKLKEKYGDNKEELNKRTVELYQKEGVNPAAGCLPLLIQMPIFIALYSAFRDGAIPLDAAFLGFKLSEPDSMIKLGTYAINVLPILTAIVTLWQQKMMQVGTGASKDATSQSMQTMMYTMPILMLFIFYKQSSGLNLYFLANSLLSVLQQYYVLSRRKNNG